MRAGAVDHIHSPSHAWDGVPDTLGTRVAAFALTATFAIAGLATAGVLAWAACWGAVSIAKSFVQFMQ